MILAAGLSPAWQQILQFESLRHGEVNRAHFSQWCASGKVLNVAVAARNLAEPTTVLSTIGGKSGELIAEEFAALDIAAEWVETSAPTRVCTTILEECGTTTELVAETPPVTDQVIDEFVDRFRTFAQVADVCVLTGSVPANTPEDFYSRLLRNVPMQLILDIRGPGLLQCLPFGPFVVKPNREELEATFAMTLADETSLLQAMRTLNARGARWVVISDGSQALYATSAETTYKLTPPVVDTVNPIGCGDCLAAGMAVAIARGETMPFALRQGVAAAALNASQLLPGRFSAHNVADLAESICLETLPEA